MGGMIGKLLSFVRVVSNGAKVSDVKIDVGGGDVLTAQHSQESGADSNPLPDDYLVTIRIPRSGALITVGFVEPDALQKAQPGERRIYARGSNRAEVVELWLKNDGTATLDNANGSFTLSPDGSQLMTNANGSFELRADGSQRGENANGFYELKAGGTVDINTATIDPAGNIVATSFTLASGAGGLSTAGKLTAALATIAGKELAGHDHEAGTEPGNTGPNN